MECAPSPVVSTDAPVTVQYQCAQMPRNSQPPVVCLLWLRSLSKKISYWFSGLLYPLWGVQPKPLATEAEKQREKGEPLVHSVAVWPASIPVNSGGKGSITHQYLLPLRQGCSSKVIRKGNIGLPSLIFWKEWDIYVLLLNHFINFYSSHHAVFCVYLKYAI